MLGLLFIRSLVGWFVCLFGCFSFSGAEDRCIRTPELCSCGHRPGGILQMLQIIDMIFSCRTLICFKILAVLLSLGRCPKFLTLKSYSDGPTPWVVAFTFY